MSDQEATVLALSERISALERRLDDLTVAGVEAHDTTDAKIAAALASQQWRYVQAVVWLAGISLLILALAVLR